MPYCPYLKIECFDAEFVFGGFDKAFSKIASAAMSSGGVIDTDNLNAEQFGAFIEVFSEGVVSWHGVVGLDGEPLPCTRENKEQAIPTMQKVKIVELLFATMQGIDEKKGPSSDTPTTLTVEE